MDTLSTEERSKLMSRIRGKNTKPELLVRSWLHRHGFRFRLHRKDLPGKPDIVLPKYKAVILVHGCFWHQHMGCRNATMPKTNRDFWEKKLSGNTARDNRACLLLKDLGFSVIVVWECEVLDGSFVKKLQIGLQQTCPNK